MKYLFLACFSLLTLAVTAQDIDAKKVLKDVETLSSDAYEGRKVGTKGSKLAADYIIGRFRQIGLAPYGADYKHAFSFKNRRNEEFTGTNLLAIIPGKTAGRIVISAHYDHVGVVNGEIFNGADDNASGVGGLLAIAGYFRKNKPNNTIIIAAFDAEESGLQGARAFVADSSNAAGGIRLNINMDMISHSDKGELYACGTFAYPELKKYVTATVPGVKLLLGHDDPKLGHDDWTNQSDQGAFAAKKIPFLYFGVEDHKDYHKATDEFSTINTTFYTAAVKTVLGVAVRYDRATTN